MTIDQIQKEEDETILKWYYYQLKPRYLYSNNLYEIESNLKKLNLISYKLFNKITPITPS